MFHRIEFLPSKLGANTITVCLPLTINIWLIRPALMEDYPGEVKNSAKITPLSGCVSCFLNYTYFLKSSVLLIKLCLFLQEASAVVKVTLKEDSGNEPVEDVIVSWALLSPDGSEQLLSGTELTTANGQVGPLKLKVTSLILAEKNIVLTGKHMLPLKVSFRKVSEGITHTFLCEDETILCPSDGFIRYLSHLDFRTLIHSVDATTLLLEGNVYSGMKDAESGLVHYTGCPLHNIQVCLMRKTPHGQDISLNCTNTGALFNF